ncbi:MAG: hypothetical protein GSR85_08095 [Desulfurococcales archaeon]|nr:hypothetical protein [Desulfurococcales archaeon]
MIPIIYLKIRRVIHKLARRKFLLLAVVFLTLWSSSALLFYHYEKSSDIGIETSFY